VSTRCEHPLGAFENPLSRAQVEEKFRLYAAGVLPDERISEVTDAVNRLEAFGSARALVTLLRISARPRAMAAAE
jgi:2-methylcitrate dehydratase PrpD